MSSTLFVKGSTSKTCIIALAVQAREDHRHHPVHAVRGSSDKGRPVRVGQKSADTNSTRCNAAQSMASAGYTAPPSSHEGSQQPSQGQAGAAKRIQGRNLPNLFFRPTPDGSRQVVYQAGKTIAFCKFTELMQWQHQ